MIILEVLIGMAATVVAGLVICAIVVAAIIFAGMNDEGSKPLTLVQVRKGGRGYRAGDYAVTGSDLSDAEPDEVVPITFFGETGLRTSKMVRNLRFVGRAADMAEAKEMIFADVPANKKAM